MKETLSNQDFEHMLVDISLNVTPSSGNPPAILKHERLVAHNAEYSKLFQSFTKASQKLFEGIDPNKKTTDASLQDWTRALDNFKIHRAEHQSALNTASIMYNIFRALPRR